MNEKNERADGGQLVNQGVQRISKEEVRPDMKGRKEVGPEKRSEEPYQELLKLD